MDERPTKRRGPITLLMTSRRFRWAVILLVVLPVLYVASFGPACWLAYDSRISLTIVAETYRPVIRCANASPDPIRHAITTCSGERRSYSNPMLEQPGMLGLLTEILDGMIGEL